MYKYTVYSIIYRPVFANFDRCLQNLFGSLDRSSRIVSRMLPMLMLQPGIRTVILKYQCGAAFKNVTGISSEFSINVTLRSWYVLLNLFKTLKSFRQWGKVWGKGFVYLIASWKRSQETPSSSLHGQKTQNSSCTVFNRNTFFRGEI